MSPRTPPELWGSLFNFAGRGVIHMEFFPVLAFDPLYPNPKPDSRFAKVTATGDTTLYTVPAGRKAFTRFIKLANNGLSSVTAHLFTTINATRLRVTSNVTISAGFAANVLCSHLLLSGESLSVNLTAQPLSIWLDVLEFDETSLFQRHLLINPAAGDVLLFQLNANRRALIASDTAIPPLYVANGGEIQLSNEAVGSTVTVWVYFIPAGQTLADDFFIEARNVSNNSVLRSTALPTSMSPLDAIWLNISTATPTQSYEVVTIEIPT